MSGKGRGRKAKAEQAEKADTVNTVIIPEEKKVPARKGNKKQFSVVAVVTHDSIEGNLQPESRKPLIAHLPIQSRDVVFHDAVIQYNPIPPTTVEPYDAEEEGLWNGTLSPPVFTPSEQQSQITTTLSSSSSSSQNQNQNQNQEQEQQSQSQSIVQPSLVHPLHNSDNNNNHYHKSTLLVQYQATSEIRKLPDRIDVACFWCCHTFTTSPVILPIKDQGEYLEVHGNFCSPECAMAYLFDVHTDSYSRWEQLSLLNRLYGEAVGGPIKPAPPRQILKLFGGPMSIEDYRNIIRKGTLRVDIHLPPMVSLLATMDTKPIDFYDVSLTKNVMETVKERLVKAEEVLKLKRTKPLKAWESTLDACINLRVRA